MATATTVAATAAAATTTTTATTDTADGRIGVLISKHVWNPDRERNRELLVFVVLFKDKEMIEFKTYDKRRIQVLYKSLKASWLPDVKVKYELSDVRVPDVKYSSARGEVYEKWSIEETESSMFEYPYSVHLGHLESIDDIEEWKKCAGRAVNIYGYYVNHKPLPSYSKGPMKCYSVLMRDKNKRQFTSLFWINSDFEDDFPTRRCNEDFVLVLNARPGGENPNRLSIQTNYAPITRMVTDFYRWLDYVEDVMDDMIIDRMLRSDSVSED